jgi:hypothetical protein
MEGLQQPPCSHSRSCRISVPCIRHPGLEHGIIEHRERRNTADRIRPSRVRSAPLRTESSANRTSLIAERRRGPHPHRCRSVRSPRFQLRVENLNLVCSGGAHQGRRRHDTARRRQRARCIGKPKYREPRIDIVLRSGTGGHKIRYVAHLITVGLVRSWYDYRQGHRHAMVLEAGADCRN